MWDFYKPLQNPFWNVSGCDSQLQSIWSIPDIWALVELGRAQGRESDRERTQASQENRVVSRADGSTTAHCSS